ncbi:MAG: hypothetical protein ACP5VE_13655 [Chthonomonadales bacterium]
MNRKVNPVVAVIILVAALVAVGIAGFRVLSASGGSASHGFRLQPANPEDPHFKPDPKLAGGGG